MNAVLDSPQTLFCLLGLLSLALLLVLAQILGFKCLRSWGNRAGKEKQLRPAELAYIYKEGDMVHTIAVLCFDLIHRQIKSSGSIQSFETEQSAQETLPEPLSSLSWEAPIYETRVMARLKSQSLDWLKSKTSFNMPANMYSLEGIKFFHGLFKRISYFYKLVMASSKQLFTKVIKDPKKIFSYISFAGVGRFTADILSSGYQNLLEEELLEYLRQNHLVVQEKSCQKLALLFFILGITSCLVVFYLLYQITINTPASTIQTALPINFMPWLIMGFAGFNALVCKLLLGLRSLIPMYEELNRLLVNVEKSSSLIKTLRFLLNAVSTMSWVLNLGIALLLNSSQMILFHFLFGIPVLNASLIDFVSSLSVYTILSLFVDGWKLMNTPIASQCALRQVEQTREKLKEVNAIKSLQNTVSSGSYNTEFAELIAVYGIEVLWLLS
jgi:uncharacterized protein with PQ loop repeat